MTKGLLMDDPFSDSFFDPEPGSGSTAELMKEDRSLRKTVDEIRKSLV